MSSTVHQQESKAPRTNADKRPKGLCVTMLWHRALASVDGMLWPRCAHPRRPNPVKLSSTRTHTHTKKVERETEPLCSGLRNGQRQTAAHVGGCGLHGAHGHNKGVHPDRSKTTSALRPATERNQARSLRVAQNSFCIDKTNRPRLKAMIRFDSCRSTGRTSALNRQCTEMPEQRQD